MPVSKRPNPYSDKSRHMYNTRTQSWQGRSTTSNISANCVLLRETLPWLEKGKICTVVSGHVNVSFLNEEQWHSNRCTKRTKDQRPFLRMAAGTEIINN